MTGLVRKATFFVACAMLLGAAAYAGIVSPANSTVGANRINLVGFNSAGAGDQADSTALLSKLTITVRDIANNPVAGVPVVLDFSGCTGDVKIAQTQSYHAEATGACATATVQGYTTTNGTISFVVIGGKSLAGTHTNTCCKVYADSYQLGSGIGVGTFDMNNAAGLTLADLGAWATDYFGGVNPDRADYNGDASVTLADLGSWASAYFGGNSNSSGAVLCP